MSLNDRLSQFHRRIVSGKQANLFEIVIFCLLLPLSALYGAVTWLRNLAYSNRLFATYTSSLPVVSVGNITVGGTGKTPMVDYLVKTFSRAGKRPAIVSRGYGGSFKGAVGCVSDGGKILMAASESGDEPYLLALRNPACPVFVAGKRSAAVQLIERQELADVIILDDAYQHRSLHRDVDIVLLDSLRPFGNGWPLPAGNLREFKTGLDRADIVVLTKCENKDSISRFDGHSTFFSRYAMSSVAVSLDGTVKPLSELHNFKCVAFSGIANPGHFFASLEAAGLQLSKTIPFADHVDYSHMSTLNQLTMAINQCEALITTEKDAVKLTADMFECPCFYVTIDVEIDGAEAFLEELDSRLWSEK